MIIYKIQESGKATDFQHAKKCPDGWKSIEGDKIPEDISIYHEQKYIDSQDKTAYIGLRKSAYNEAGLTFDYWNELSIEKNTAGQTAFRAKRDEIRAAIPKPQI